MSDSIDSCSRSDLHLKVQLVLEDGDGTQILEMDVDRSFPGVLDHTDVGGIEERVGMLFFHEVISRVLCSVRNYAQSLRPSQPVNKHFQRLDHTFSLSRLVWMEEPTETDRELRHVVEELEIHRLNSLLESD